MTAEPNEEEHIEALICFIKNGLTIVNIRIICDGNCLECDGKYTILEHSRVETNEDTIIFTTNQLPRILSVESVLRENNRT